MSYCLPAHLGWQTFGRYPYTHARSGEVRSAGHRCQMAAHETNSGSGQIQ